jgi:hypothetical protein
MATIKQNVEVSFHCIELEDAMVIKPLMTALAKTIEYNKAVELYNGLHKEEKDRHKAIYKRDALLNCDLAPRVYEILSKYGFCTVSKISCAYDVLKEHRK